MLPKPTIEDMKNYKAFISSPRYIVKYRKFYLNNKHHSTIERYGFFKTIEEAKNHFNNLPKFYSWKKDKYASEFIDIVIFNSKTKRFNKCKNGKVDNEIR